MPEQTTLEGFISIEAALKAASRDIYHIYARRGKMTRQITYLQQASAEQDIPFELIDSEQFQDLAQGKSHGGLIALTGERHFTTLEALTSAVTSTSPLVIMLDGIEDPYNFAYAIRAFYAAGADGLVVQPRNWLSASAVVARASAGASELMPTAVAETPETAVDFFRSRKFTIAGTAKGNTTSLYKANLTGPLFLLIGGEKRGITRTLRRKMDLQLQIPYGRPFSQSLGTTAAAAILAFEIMRQRQIA